MFNIYLNDKVEHITESTLVQYADDTQFVHYDSLRNIYKIIEKAERTLAKAKNGLIINPSKTQCIFIGSNHLMAQIPDNISNDFDGTSIFPSTHVKNLRLHMGRYMVFDTHISELTKRMISMLSFISRVSCNFDRRTRETVVQYLVLSLINYCVRI